MQKKRFFIFSTVFLVLIVSGLYLLIPMISAMQTYLSKSERTNGNVLIIEGWLSYNSLQQAMNEINNGNYEYILTTGLKATSEYYNVYTDGFLIFYPHLEHNADTKSSVHTIEVKAYSELEGEDSAHFRLWVNDCVCNQFLAGRKKRRYGVLWNGTLPEIDSIMVEFDNDIVSKSGDRNLFVKELIIDKKFKVPFLNNSEYDILKLDGKYRIINNLSSNAEMTAERLVSLGADSSKVIPVPGNKVRINRTLTSALAVREWLRKSDIKITGIDIISAGTHSRRTWMTFSTVLDRNYSIGIIALPDQRDTKTDKIHIRKTLRETVAFLYYWIILIPYRI